MTASDELGQLNKEADPPGPACDSQAIGHRDDRFVILTVGPFQGFLADTPAASTSPAKTKEGSQLPLPSSSSGV